jgi:hypothetical protein
VWQSIPRKLQFDYNFLCRRISEVRAEKGGWPGDNGGQPQDEGAALRSIQTLYNA